MNKLKRIALLNLHAIGDCIMFLPTIRAVSAQYHESQILVFVRNATITKVLECANLPRNVRICDFQQSSSKKGFRLKKFHFEVWRKILEFKPEAIISMVELNKYFTPLMLRLSNARITIGDRSGLGKYFYTNPVNTSVHDHQVMRNLSLLHELDIQIPDIPDINISPSSDRLSRMAALITQLFPKRPKLIVAISPFATVGQIWRIWPPVYWARLCSILSKSFDVGFLVLGGSSYWERNLGKVLFDELHKGLKAVNLIGRLDIRDTIAVLKQSDFICGADNGLLHLAAAVGTFVHAIWTVTPREHYPYTTQKQIIYGECYCKPGSIRKECLRKPRCMYDLKSENVAKTIGDIWANQLCGVGR